MREKKCQTQLSRSASGMNEVENEDIIVFLHSFNENVQNSKTNAALSLNLSPVSNKY